MDAANIRMVAIGLEELGAEDFIKGNYFDGDVYIDMDKKSYKDLGYSRLNFSKIVRIIFAKQTRAVHGQAKKAKIAGDHKGNKLQNGGVIIVKPGGEILLDYKQDNPVETVSCDQLLKVLDIDTPAPPADLSGTTVVCDDGACAMK